MLQKSRTIFASRNVVQGLENILRVHDREEKSCAFRRLMRRIERAATPLLSVTLPRTDGASRQDELSE